MTYPTSAVRCCITAVILLSEYALGGTAEQGHFMTHAADCGPVLHDKGRLLLFFCMVTFVVLTLAFRSYKSRAGAADKFGQPDTDPLDLILMTCTRCLHYGVCALCTAVAACWRSLVHIFTTKADHQLMASPALPSSASVPPMYPPPASSSSTPPSPKLLLPNPLVAGSSSFDNTSNASQTMATLGQWNALLTTRNCWLSSQLKGVERSNTHLQKQLQNACAALLTSRSNAKNAEPLVAQANAQKQRYKAALREMKACVEEMYTEGELAFECILNEKKALSEKLQQERASRVQETQTLMNQIDSLTAQLSSIQGEFSFKRQQKNQLAKHNNELRREKDLARRTATAVTVCLRKEIGKRSAAEHAEAMRETKAFLAAWPSKKAPVGLVPCPTTAQPCSPSSTRKSAMPVASSPSFLCSSETNATAPNQSSPSGLNKPPTLAFPIEVADMTTRKPFLDSISQAVTVQAAATKTMPEAPRSLSASAVSKETEACSLSTTVGAKENVQPGVCIFSVSSRQRSSLDTRQFTTVPSIRFPAGAVTSPVRRQSLSPTTATEAHRNIVDVSVGKGTLGRDEMRYTDDKNRCPAQLSRFSPTGQGANGILSENSTQATAARAVRSTASSSALPRTATEANNFAKSSCTVAHVQYDMTASMSANMAATVKAGSGCHMPPVKNTQGIIATTRLDETSSSLMTLAHYHKGRKHSN